MKSVTYYRVLNGDLPPSLYRVKLGAPIENWRRALRLWLPSAIYKNEGELARDGVTISLKLANKLKH